MRIQAACLFCLGSILSLAISSYGQELTSPAMKARTEALEQEEGKDRGDQAYTMSCSVAASLGIVACAELPSGRQTLESQKAAEVTGGVAEIQKLRDDAADVSKSAFEALQHLSDLDSQSTEDTSGAEAAILQKVKEAADNVVAAAPDALAQAKSDATQPASDGVVPSYTTEQRLIIGGSGAPAEFAQDNSPTKTDENPSQPTQTSDDTAARQPAQPSRFVSALSNYRQALGALNQFATQHPANASSSSSVLSHSSGPKLVAPGSAPPCYGVTCRSHK